MRSLMVSREIVSADGSSGGTGIMQAGLGSVYDYGAFEEPVPKDVVRVRETSYTLAIQRSVSSMGTQCRQPLTMPQFRPVTTTGRCIHAHADGMEVAPQPI